MSAPIYDSIRVALTTAIQAGDPTCLHIYDFLRYLKQPTAQATQAIFFDATNKIYHAWQFTQGPSNPEEIEAEDDGQSVVCYTEQWWARGLYTINDSLASERTFRQIVENVKTQIRQNAAMLSLADIPNVAQVYVQSVAQSGMDFRKVNGEELVHWIELTIDFSIMDTQ